MTAEMRKVGGLKTIDVHAHMIALGGPEKEEKYKAIMPYLSRDAAGREVLAVKGRLICFRNISTGQNFASRKWIPPALTSRSYP